MKTKKRNITVAWIVLLLEMAVAAPAHALYRDFPTDVLIIFPHCLVMLMILLNDRQCRVPMTVGYVLRIAAMIFDCYTLALSNMNGDTLGYYADGVQWVTSGKTRYGGMYSRILGVIFRQVGASWQNI